MQTQHLTPQPAHPRGEAEPEAHRATQRAAAPAVGASDGRPLASGRPAPHARASQPPRRSKADSLRLVHRLKQALAVGAIVGFSVFGGLVATRLPSIGSTASAAASSSTTTSSSTNSGGYFGQGSNGSGVSGSSSSSSSTSSAPISGTSVS